MGACETTPATSHDRGKAGKRSPSKTTQPGRPRSSLPITGRRLAASSSFVLASALAGRTGLRALQLDTQPPRRHKPGSDKETRQ